MTKEILDRIRKEKEEIYNRICKLSDFIDSDEFRKLSIPERNMLINQEHVMKIYSLILHDRIAYYEGKPLVYHWEGVEYERKQKND